jgi:hypothetical protein
MPQSMSRLAVLFALAAALSACPRTTTTLPPDDAGTLDFVGRACNVDAECGTLRCDKIRRQCICLSDESCKPADPMAPPRYCNNYTGLCVTEISGCTSDSQCGSTEWCDPSIRTCRPLKTFCEPCSADRECGGADDDCILDTTLNRRFCGTACTTNADCVRGATCQDKGGRKQCWPDRTPNGVPATCKNFQACTPDSLRTCNQTSDCGDVSQRCDLAKGKCVAVQQICPFGTVCDPRLKLCVAECLQDADCGDVRLRCVNRICEPVDECTRDADCAANQVCVVPPGGAAGECKPSCSTDADCPLGKVCTPSGTRAHCLPGCTTNADCPLDQRCNGTSRQCEGPVVGVSRVCQATSACRTCELCDGVTNVCTNARTGFPYCQPCSSPSECGGGACVTLPDGQGYCARFCGTGQECPQGFVCLSLTTGGQACVPSDRSCTGKCP